MLDTEEVQYALVEATEIPDEEVKMRAIRPAFEGTQMALVTMHTAAQPLIKNRMVRIGWVRERITVLRCCRCLRFGQWNKVVLFVWLQGSSCCKVPK